MVPAQGRLVYCGFWRVFLFLTSLASGGVMSRPLSSCAAVICVIVVVVSISGGEGPSGGGGSLVSSACREDVAVSMGFSHYVASTLRSCLSLLELFSSSCSA